MNQANNAVEIRTLELVNFKGRTLDLVGLFESFMITEDLFSNVLYGYIKIKDTLDLKQNFPLIGEERINIKFRTKVDDPDEFDWIENQFYVFSIPVEEKSPNSSKAESILAFCSEELLLNRTQLVSRSFKQMTASDVIAQLLRDLPSDKPFVAEETFGIQTYIAPNLHPFEICSSMSARARSKEFPESSGFLFYETLDGYAFNCIDKLISSPQVFEYTESKLGFGADKGEDTFFSIHNYTVDNDVDVLGNINSGMYGNTTHSFNIQLREYRVFTYNYFDDEDYEKTNHLEGKNPALRLQTSLFPFASRANQSMLKFVPQYANDQLRDANISIRYSQIAQIMNGFKMRIEVDGNSKLRVGQKIGIKIPSKLMDDRETQSLDRFLSGNYLVTCILHAVTGDKYSCSVEIVKDSFSSDHEEIADELFNRIGSSL